MLAQSSTGTSQVQRDIIGLSWRFSGWIQRRILGHSDGNVVAATA